MTEEIKIYKEISTVPVPYEPNALYYVRVGTGIDIYLSNSTGDAIFKHNQPKGLDVLTENPSNPTIGQQWILEVNTIGELQYNSFFMPMVKNEKTHYLCFFNGIRIKKTILN